MTSNIKVQRICQHCGNEFTARTTITKHCSDYCSKRAYKARIKAEKINKVNEETRQIKSRSTNNDLKEQEFLTVTDASKLINCSRQNIYKLIKAGKLRATNILIKKTIIRRSDLDLLFTEPPELDLIPETQKQELDQWRQAGKIDITDCYTLKEVQTKYGISETALQNLIKRERIPKIKMGWFSYVPKPLIDKFLS